MTFVALFLFIVHFFLPIQTIRTYSDIFLQDLTQNDGAIFKSDIPVSLIGNTVKYAGDFNNDGYDDVIFGGHNLDSTTGKAYIIYGDPNGLSDVTVTNGLSPNKGVIISGEGAQNLLGFSVSYAGDVNGDDIDDVIIGAYQYLSGKGRVYIIYGSNNPPPAIDLSQGLSASQGFIVTGSDPNMYFGYCVSWAGDVNGDGVDDLIIGAHNYDGNKGAAFVIFGKKGNRGDISLANGLNSNDGFMILGAVTNDMIGVSVSRAGDMNGDQVDDVVIGGSGVSNSGAAFVIYGKKNPPYNTIDLSQALSASEGFSILGSVQGGSFGLSVGSAGDFNKDGKLDIVVAAPMKDLNKGSVFVIFGQGSLNSNLNLGSGLAADKGLEIVGANQGDFFGKSVSIAGDINGDGISDIICGASLAESGTGIAYIFFGRKGLGGKIELSAGLDNKQGFRIVGPDSSQRIGVSASYAGDVNKDGKDDIIIGGYGGPSFPGIVYLLSPKGACPENCLTCQPDQKCLSCVDGYGLSNFLCVSACPSSTELVSGVCTPKKSPPLKTAVEIAKGAFDSGSTSSRIFTMGRSLSVGLGLIAKIIQNVRFLNISYSAETLSAFESYGTSLWEPPIPEFLYEPPETKDLANQYAKYDINATFLENYWQTIMTMLVSIACFLIIRMFQYLTRKQDKRSFLRVALRNMGQTAANFIIIQVYSNLDDVIFFFLLDASTTKFSSPSAGFSMASAVIFLLLGIALVFFHCWVLGKYQQAKEQDKLESFKKKFRIVGTLYDDFKDDSAIKQSFFGILILRCIILVLVIMLLGPPWIQASLLMGTNLAFLAFMIYQRPYTGLFDEVVQYFCEATVFVAYLSVLVLSFLDYQENFTSSARNGLGKAIVLSGIVLCLGGFIAQIIQIAGVIREIYKFCKSSWSTKKKVTISPASLIVKPDQSKDPKQTPPIQEKPVVAEDFSSNLISLKDEGANDQAVIGSAEKALARESSHLDISYANSDASLIVDPKKSEGLRRAQTQEPKKKIEDLTPSQRLLKLQGSPSSFRNMTKRDKPSGKLVVSVEPDISVQESPSKNKKKFKRKPRLPDDLVGSL